MWGNCDLTLKNKLQSLQNRASLVVTRTKYGCVEPDQLSKNLRWLNVQQLINFDTAVRVYKSINNKAPPYLTSLFSKSNSVHNHDTRTANLNLFPTHARLKFGQKCFSHYGCHLWNKLDRDVQAIDFTEKFKVSLKNRFLYTNQRKHIVNNGIFLTYVIYMIVKNFSTAPWEIKYIFKYLKGYRG